MMIQAVLGNPNHPEYGVATIPFPIPHDQYAHCMELLEALEIGDAVKADCKVTKIDSFYTVLKRTEMLTVNVEELNYLAKRLESFDTGEAAQFQAMAHKLELFELKDLINLTFCCQQATVITDFSDLAAVGRDHYMNLHGGCAKTEELDALDGEETARRLIENGGGTVTPYGVVYDNGMKLEQIYDGRFFPCYYYLDIDVFADAMLCDIRFKVPYIGELIRDTDCPAVEDYNDFAEALEDIWQQDGMLLTYAAVLEAERPDTLRGACEFLRNLDNYQRIVEGAYGYGQQRLQETLGLDDEAIYELDGYMDFEKYGQDCMENDCVTKTEFGLLRRLEPPFPEQTQGQRMFQ